MERKIHINWDGPFSLNEAKTKCDNDCYGIYQYYGMHPVYGPEILLYIGKAFDQDFSERLNQHVHESWSSAPVNILLGRIVSKDILEESEWREQIDIAESLLIYTHSPSWNSSSIKSIKYEKQEGVHIFNWGHRGALLPEVSYERWSGTGNEMPDGLQYQK